MASAEFAYRWKAHTVTIDGNVGACTEIIEALNAEQDRQEHAAPPLDHIFDAICPVPPFPEVTKTGTDGKPCEALIACADCVNERWCSGEEKAARLYPPAPRPRDHTTCLAGNCLRLPASPCPVDCPRFTLSDPRD
jgi:hypothetical protein